MSEMNLMTSEVMALVEEKIRPKRETIVLEHLNLKHYYQALLHSVLSFLF
jgi:hypothetical protein